MKKLNIAPIALTTSLGTNLLNGAITSLSGPIGFTMPAPRLIVTKMQFVNTTGAAITVSLFKGATGAHAAGSEVFGSGLSIPANQVYTDYGEMPLDAADFLTGGASATGVTLRIEADLDFV
jgi:hypothetical protein